MHPISSSLMAIVLLSAFASSQAETLTLEQQQALENQPVIPLTDAERAALANKPLFSVEMPARGMSMSSVSQRFGNPTKKIAPVGEPPISRWIYDKYTVYFEGQYVIHSVLH